jgi:hypothetical protein
VFRSNRAAEFHKLSALTPGFKKNRLI